MGQSGPIRRLAGAPGHPLPPEAAAAGGAGSTDWEGPRATRSAQSSQSHVTWPHAQAGGDARPRASGLAQPDRGEGRTDRLRLTRGSDGADAHGLRILQVLPAPPRSRQVRSMGREVPPPACPRLIPAMVLADCRQRASSDLRVHGASPLVEDA